MLRSLRKAKLVPEVALECSINSFAFQIAVSGLRWLTGPFNVR